MDGPFFDYVPAADVVTRTAEWPIASSAVAPMIAWAIVALILISLTVVLLPTKSSRR
ncbi:MAG: hypothetical protein INR70_34620 [Parafilimonas terrae]|uniref:hypothetical protein n=1 Tax=Methylobacterium mesophilicum TaxID=39956 RepID=UPI0002C61366|nr:hypothetical protein [Methylobacterium mesophilicum]MBE7202905.1 hypothetical protein [Parafilimonas terrae]